jgi:hypothetical protein
MQCTTGAGEGISGKHSVAIGDERDKANGITLRDQGLAIEHAYELKLLGVEGADGDNHSSTFAELRE